jgi:hypothetical protein
MQSVIINHSCPLCRRELLTTQPPDPPPERVFNPLQLLTPPQILQRIIHAYEHDKQNNNILTPLTSRLLEIIMYEIPIGNECLLNYLATHHLEHVTTELSSQNIFNILISSIERDEAYFHQNNEDTRNQPEVRHKYLINTLYNLLHHNRSIILNHGQLQVQENNNIPRQSITSPSVVFFHPD